MNVLGPHGKVIKTHFRNPCCLDSVPFDFFNDGPGDLLDKHNVDIVIFSGLVETHPFDEVSFSMERFARECKDRRVTYLSSDGIFDGEKRRYSESDIPHPRTLYGNNLAICEQLIARFCANFCIIRPSYIYGFSNGNLDRRLSKTRTLLETGHEVSLFSDMFKSPLSVKQVAQAVVDLTLLGYVGIAHVAGERMSVYDFHRQAMLALHVDTLKLSSCLIPSGEDFLRDTSLDYSLWQKLTNTSPQSIGESLSS